MIFAGDAYK